MIKAKKSIEKTEEYVYPTPFNKILTKFKLKEKDILKLDYNEPTIPPCPKVKKTLINYINNGKLEWYPEGDCNEIRKELGIYCKINPENIIVGNGSDEILKVIANTFLTEDDEVIIPIPNYSMFMIDSKLVGAKIIKILVTKAFTSDKIKEKITTKTKIIYLSNPNSPLGYSLNKDEIKKIINLSKKVLVVVDEAYFEFYGQSIINLVEKYDNLIVTRTMSKAFSLASLRIGYGVANTNIISELNKVKDPESVNSFAQIAGIEALKDIEYRTEFINNILKSKEYLEIGFRKLGLKVWPSKTNFLFITFPEKYNAYNIWKNLEKKGIFLRDRTKVINNSLRIGVPLIKESKRLIKEIKKELNPLLIFDIDEVLIDTMLSYNETIKKSVKNISGKKISDKDVRKVKLLGGYNCDWDTTLKLVNDKGINIDREKVIEVFQKIYLGTNKKEGLRNKEKWLMNKKLLKNLSKNYKLSILTGRPKDEAIYSLKRENVLNFFEQIICMEDVNQSKPNPEGLLEIKSKGEEAYYFGDLGDDMKAAKAAGIKAVGVIPPENKDKNYSKILKNAGADFVIKNINQINEVLK